MQLTNAGLEMCWRRAVRMHWRAGAAKERPASILREVRVGRWVSEGVYGRGAVVLIAANYAILQKRAAEQSKAWLPGARALAQPTSPK